jgi:hypothetical protein
VRREKKRKVKVIVCIFQRSPGPTAAAGLWSGPSIPSSDLLREKKRKVKVIVYTFQRSPGPTAAAGLWSGSSMPSSDLLREYDYLVLSALMSPFPTPLAPSDFGSSSLGVTPPSGSLGCREL